MLLQSYSGVSDDDAGGDEDQESSSSLHDVDALKSFREQWQRELRISPKHTIYSQTKKAQASDNHVIEGKVIDGKIKDQKSEELSIETKVMIIL